MINRMPSEIEGSKKMAVEKIYQKKTQLEHILLRPDTYVGSMERLEQEMWIWDFENEKMIKKEIKYVPGLFKIFDEILGKHFFLQLFTYPIVDISSITLTQIFFVKD